MSITFNCPDCSQAMSVPDSFAGKKGKCPGCGVVVTIPAGGAPPPPDRQRGTQAAPGGMKTCPMCGEQIKVVAKKCRYCGEFFDPSDRPSVRSGGAPPRGTGRRHARRREEPGSWGLGFAAGFFGGCLGLILIHTLASGRQTKSGANTGFAVWIFVCVMGRIALVTL